MAAKKKRAASSKRPTRRKLTLAEQIYVAAMIEAIEQIRELPKKYHRQLYEAMMQLIIRGESLPDEFADRIEAISIYDVDPDWQVAELEKITADLKLRH